MTDGQLRFGIPSLDRMLVGEAAAEPMRAESPSSANVPGGERRVDSSRLGLAEAGESLKLCIIGSDGTGKSVLAMHLASTYLRDVASSSRAVTVAYVSTDLSYERANKIWENFRLDLPGERTADPFEVPPGGRGLSVSRPPEPALELQRESPFGLDLRPSRSSVRFIDLAAETVGDDWTFVNELLAILDAPDKAPAPRHLVIIDAVEGLEAMLKGDEDASDVGSRRSRIAQVVRTARRKAHLLFVVEEAHDGSKTAEEFVADVVIRLGFRKQRDYQRRTLEVEKVRGRSHIRGQHDFLIRDGRGTTTGAEKNPDDPAVPNDPDRAHQDQSYFFVLPSLHRQSREIMEAGGSATGNPDPVPSDGTVECGRLDVAGFGIQYLDEMLGRQFSSKRRSGDRSSPLATELRGLPVDAPTALIGEEGTYKSRLARAYLSQCFAVEKDDLGSVACLLTTKDLDRDDLKKRFRWHLSSAAMIDGRRVLCRRLEIHQLSSSVLMHIVRCLIEAAQKKLYDKEGLSTWPDHRERRRRWGGRIRLAIDNWTAIRNAYPEIRDDPLFLPFLLFYLRREGVGTLILATENGGPRRIHESRDVADLLELTPHHLFTWRVPFFGGSRIAITVVPSINPDRPALIRELKVDRRPTGDTAAADSAPLDVGRPEGLVVDPHFELYADMEEGKPTPIPLRVHLYAETEHCRPYIDEMNSLLCRLRGLPQTDQVVVPEGQNSYERLREYCQLQGRGRLNETQVLQVDEFWSESSPFPFREQRSYLEAVTVEADGSPAEVEDPFRHFQPSRADQPGDGASTGQPPFPRQRYEYFSTVGHDYAEYIENGKLPIDKVPYLWDFGFLLARKSAWDRAREERLATSSMTVGGVFDALVVGRKSQYVSWRDFFDACHIVASSTSRSDTFAFDVSMIAPETFSCTVLEIWASEIGQKPEVFPSLRHDCQVGSSGRIELRVGLIELLQQYPVQLYNAWGMLGRVFKSGQFLCRQKEFESRRAKSSAIAARHWYSTACDCIARHDPPTCRSAGPSANDQFVPLALPGRFSVRGDWFLAVARGSRSSRLGSRAIDVLSSRRGNIVRLQQGLGLPVRDSAGERHAELWTPLSRPEGDISYDELRTLGAKGADNAGGREDLQWLWRSLLRNYDRHARIWQRWLCHMLMEWEKWGRQQVGESPNLGFRSESDHTQTFAQLPGGLQFWHEVKCAIATLKRATPAWPSTDDRAL